MSHTWLTNHGTTTCESFGLDPVTARDTQSLTLLGLLGGGHQSAHLNGSWEGGALRQQRTDVIRRLAERACVERG